MGYNIYTDIYNIYTDIYKVYFIAAAWGWILNTFKIGKLKDVRGRIQSIQNLINIEI